MITIITVLAGLIGIFVFFAIKHAKEKAPAIYARVELTGMPQPAFEVSIKGELRNTGSSVSYTVFLSDQTDGVSHPILSEIGNLNDTQDLLSIKSPLISKAKNSVLPDWTKVITLPVDKIKLARNGTRTLVFDIQVDDQPYVSQCTLNYTCKEKGFLDIRERLDDIYTAIFYLLAGLRTLLEDSANIPELSQAWLETEGIDWPQKNQLYIAQQFQRIIMGNENSVDWKDACEHYTLAIRLHANPEIRRKMIQLFFQVLESAPETVPEAKRLEILFSLSHSTGSDMGQFCRMAEKIFPDSYLQMDSDSLLGIHKNMEAADITERLREEYKTWNSRASHPNKSLRTQAENMLSLIARKRCELTATH